MSDRSFEIVLLGATGFTGRLTALWLAESQPDLRWALAGRNVAKLEAIRAELAAVDAKLADLPLLQVDVTKRDTVDAMTAQTRVVLTTAGPFMDYSPPVVASCVANGTDYVDITGEPGFVAAMIREHHSAAEAAKVRIVSCCGFDSIPHDMGAWFTVQQLPQTAPMEVRAYVRARGKTSGGTWNTAVEGISTQMAADTSGLVYKGEGKRAGGLKKGLHRAPEGGWAVPLPLVDPMIAIRSAQLIGYGPDFRYGHYGHIKTTRYLLAGAIGLGGVVLGSKIPPVRRWLKNQMPPGTGPSMEDMLKGWAKVTFYGREGNTEVRTRVSIPVDPGYLFTARMVAAAALSLARDRDQLPDRHGVITTAAAMAEPLKKRLEDAGMVFEVL